MAGVDERAKLMQLQVASQNWEHMRRAKGWVKRPKLS